MHLMLTLGRYPEQ